MPTVTFASFKGGAGRTTSAIVLATTLARTHKVTLIDADPAQRLTSWSKKAPLPGRLKVQGTKGERYIQDEIAEANQHSEFVIIDLEGAATRLNAFAMAESDLVIIPMGDEQQDAEGAIETLAYLVMEARRIRREIRVRVLFCRTEKDDAKSKLAKSINKDVRKKTSTLTRELRKLPAFSWLHNVGGTLYQLNPKEVDGLAKGIACAELFVEEVLQVLRFFQGHTNLSGQPSVRLRQDVHDRFQALCQREHRTSDEMLEALLAEHVSKRKKLISE